MTDFPTERAEALARLAGGSPSERMAAARTIVGPLSASEQQLVLVAVQSEAVPQIRALMEQLLDARETLAAAPTASSDDHASGDDIAKLIVHELTPAIGRIDLEASLAIRDYVTSPTATAVERLTRRMYGLAKIASTRREQLDIAPVNLLEVAQKVADDHSEIEVEVTPEDASEEEFLVSTDVDLLTMLLEAAANNACQAQGLSSDDGPVYMEIASTEISCSVTIVNKFNGGSITKDQVLALGRTTRHGGLGIGTRVIASAASRLGLDWDFRGTAGIATFMLRFPIP